MSEYPYETKRERTTSKGPPGKIRKTANEMFHEYKGDITDDFYSIDKETINDRGEVDVVKRAILHKKKFDKRR